MLLVCVCCGIWQMPRASSCDLCKLATNFLKQYVDSNTTEVREPAQTCTFCKCVCVCVAVQNEVKSALEKVCSLLPGSLSSECSSLVDQYFNMIWDLLKAEVVSLTICLMCFLSFSYFKRERKRETLHCMYFLSLG